MNPASPPSSPSADLALIRDVTSAEFAESVVERSHSVPVLVDFWAGWCGPCRTLGPQIEQVVAVADGAVELAKVDVDAQPQLAQKFNISGIPHVKLFKGGREVDSFVGVRSAADIRVFIAPHIGPSRFEQMTESLRESGRFADAIEAFDLGYPDQALDHLLRVIEQSSGDERDAARQYMVAAFEHLGAGSPVAARYRRQLASILY